MGRFMYQHFGDDVPRHIEADYNRMLRREQYLEEREAEFRAMSADFNAVQEVMPDPATLPANEIAVENRRLHDARLDLLPVALEINYVLQRAQTDCEKSVNALKTAKCGW